MIDFHNPATMKKLFEKAGLNERDFSEVEEEVRRERKQKLEQLTFGQYFAPEEIAMIRKQTQRYCERSNTPPHLIVSLQKELNSLETSLAYDLFVLIDTINEGLAEKIREGKKRLDEIRMFYG